MKWMCFFGILLLYSCGSMIAESELNSPKIAINPEDDLLQIAQELEKKSSLHSIAIVNWDKFNYVPKVSFIMGHDNENIYLKFYVSENHILAKHSTPNSSTHQDSCVEFFIDPDQSGQYYNFEFNCIGTTHLAYGPDRYNRTFIDKDKILDQIKITSTLGALPFEEKSGQFNWEMTVKLPSSIFVYHPDLKFSGLKSKANFYKCADATQTPHYLSWSVVESENPDFHRPEFFGFLNFE